MGALLSLPLLALPSIGTVWSIAASCCGAATCTALCNACGKFQSSMATRIAYAFILLLNSVFAWIMLTPWAIHKLEHLTLDYMTFDCGSKECYGYMAVQRINFALGLFHFLLSFLLIGVRNTRDGRAGVQNGFWGPKIIAWLAFIVISFLIPEGFFMFYGKYIAFTGAMLFVLLGLVLLVDLAHTWVEVCLQKADEADTNGETPYWRYALMTSTISMFGASLAMTIIMYVYFSGGSCGMNNAAITINLLAMLVVTAISMAPQVQEENVRAGIGQSAMVAVYCTYLTFSAVCMEPDDKQCNPLVRARGARTTTIVLGAIVTLLTVAYTTTRAATQSFFGNQDGGYVALPEDEYGPSSNHVVISEQPRARRQMLLQQAIAEGTLPASATLDDSDDEEEEDMKGGKHVKDDERRATQYNYSLFHVIFFMATCWVATLLTQSLDPDHEGESDFQPLGRTYTASWVKIISAWICYLIYTWSLVAPLVLTGRDFSG